MVFSPVQLGFDHDVFIHVGESKRERERERKRERERETWQIIVKSLSLSCEGPLKVVRKLCTIS